MSIKTQFLYVRVRLRVIGLLLFASAPALAQAGGEVVDVKVTHVASSIGVKTPPDQITLKLRVVDEQGHEARGTSELSKSGVKRWLRDQHERRLLLIDLYISLFDRLDSAVARGEIASTNAKIDPEKAREYVPLAVIAAIAKCQRRILPTRCIGSILKKK